MEDLNFGDEVEWTRGAIGLTGRVADCTRVSPDYMLLVIVTEEGIFHENEKNLRKVER